MTKTIRIAHLMLTSVVAGASVIVGVVTGLRWAGAAVGVLVGSRAVRSAMLLKEPATESEAPRRIATIISRAHGIGYLIAALLFIGSALQMETAWAAALAVGSFTAGALNLWLARRARASAS
jgi:hypothetical protein